MTMNNKPDNTNQRPDCFTCYDLAPDEKLPRYKGRRPDLEWWLFSSLISVLMSHQDWYERYSLRYFARNDLWAVCIRHASSTYSDGHGPMQLAAWCYAPADSDLAVIANALLRTWFCACKEHGGLATQFVEDEGSIDIDFDAVWGDL